MVDYPKKLIEVALPLDDINAEGAREKSLRHGHPSTLHLWWARRPLAVARAVLFAQLVNDPGGKRGWGAKRGQTKEDAQRERERLFEILRDLVQWKSMNDETVLEKARVEIWKSWRETCEITGDDPSKLPIFHDPFAGGGAIPLEAQRLGLEAHASDINPVAILINKAMIEIPPKFSGNPPVHPDQDEEMVERSWHGTEGLAEDVHYYGQWMRDEAFKRIGHLYHEVKLPKKYGGDETTVSAWIWARTVESPNPAYKGCFVPLISNFFLSTKMGKLAWIKPVVEGKKYRFEIETGTPRDTSTIRAGTKVGRGASFRCLLSNVPISSNYIKSEGRAGRIGSVLIAVVAEGPNCRVYVPPEPWMMGKAHEAEPEWVPEQELNYEPRAIWTPSYGLTTYGDLFTARQMTALCTFSGLVADVRKKILEDAKDSGMVDDARGLEDGGVGAVAYSEAVGTLLAFAVDKVTDYWSSVCSWHTSREIVRNTFGRQGISMAWDYAEVNPFCHTSGNWMAMVNWVWKSLSSLPAKGQSRVYQADAARLTVDQPVAISTDPPYYDNIGYADLSDFFYIWLRRALQKVYPDLFATMLVPKAEELIAAPYRHGGREDAELFFLEGMKRAIVRMAVNAHPALPITIYYAFKQSETKKGGTASTGWEVFLEAVMSAGFAITGTWPMRTELANKIGQGTNLLASSIVLVCRKRDEDAATIPRRQFLRELNDTLPDALESMIGGKEDASPVAPVDLAQAAIGPGIAVFSQYASVLEADGSPMTVHTALTLINKTIDEYFTQVESDMDADTRFCVDWFQQYGFKTGSFGQADVLGRAKGTSVDGVRDAGVLESGGGRVRLLRPEEYDMTWSPQEDDRVPVWEACHQICRVLNAGESDAGALLAEMPEKTEQIRQLAYRLYTVCERKGWAKEAGVYNGLVTSWREIVEARRKMMSETQEQRELL